MQGSTFRSAALAVASLGLLAACDRGDTLTAPAGQLSSKASLALEVSDVAAASGTRDGRTIPPRTHHARCRAAGLRALDPH